MAEKDPVQVEAPVFDKSVVIDSSFQSRNQLKTALEQTFLFNEVRIASSIKGAIEDLSNESFDACFLGASLSHPKADEFVKKAKDKVFSKACAFIRLTKDKDESIFRHVNGMVKWPCEVERLSKAIVNAVEDARRAEALANKSAKKEGWQVLIEPLNADQLPLEVQYVLEDVFSRGLVKAKGSSVKELLARALHVWFDEIKRMPRDAATKRLQRRLTGDAGLG